jgi:hypothetical protein
MTSGCFQKKRIALKVQQFQDIEDIKKCDYGTGSYSTTEVPKNVPNSGSITGLSA